MGFQFKHIIVFLVAVAPAAVWLYMFLKKHALSKWVVLFTFLGGMAAAKVILIYQGYWDETVNLVFFKVSLVDFRSNIESMIVNAMVATFAVFLGVGVMEEFVKFWIMKFINIHFFKSINDVITCAIIAGLGFAFYENIIYFLNQWGNLSAGGFFAFAVFRVTIVTMVHVLCSGILGYYYGMAFFASPMLKIQWMKQNRHPILEFLRRTVHLKRSIIYHDEMMVIGLVLSMVMHAIYDFVLSVGLKVFGIPLHIPIMLLYFFGGFWFLSRLLQERDHNLKLGLVGTDVMPKSDFVKLLNEVQELKEKMRTEQTDQPQPNA